jgi:hypothetical protein
MWQAPTCSVPVLALLAHQRRCLELRERLARTFEFAKCNFDVGNVLGAEFDQVVKHVGAAIPAHVSVYFNWKAFQGLNEGRLGEVRVYFSLKARLEGF